MTKEFDPDLPVQQRNGRAARMCQRTSKEPFFDGRTLEAEVQRYDGSWTVTLRYADGRMNADGDSEYELVNIPAPAPKTETRWVNVYPKYTHTGVGHALHYASRKEADDKAGPLRLGPAIHVQVPVEGGR